MGAGEQSDDSSAAVLGRQGRRGRLRTLLGLLHCPPPCTPQVKEALAVLQAHQATEHMRGVNLR